MALSGLEMGSCQKQIDAAQRFLRGIRQLPGYDEFALKQASGISKAFERVKELTPGEAAGILGSIDEMLWSTSQVEQFRQLLAQKTRAVLEDALRPTQQQDFTALPYLVSEELSTRVLCPSTDKDQLLFELCAYAAKLTLRSATEASKATIIALAYWTQLNQGMPPKEKYNLYVTKKPLVTKYLSLPAPETMILSLPMAWEELPTDVKNHTFPTGKPVANKQLAFDVMQFVRNMPLRKDHNLLQPVAATHSAASRDTTSLSVDAICKVVEACSRAGRLALEDGRVDEAASRGVPKQLALEDGRVDGAELMREPTGLPVTQASLKEDAQKPPVMSVETQLYELQLVAASENAAAMKRPASKQTLKRPAAAGERSAGSGSTGSTEAVPKAKAKGKARPKAKAKASGTREYREKIRQAILKKVPVRLKRRYRDGCNKCRYRPLCTPSCWAERGFVA